MIKTSKHIIQDLLFWLLISVVIGLVVGCFGALFLYGLRWAYETRINNRWLLWLLPLGGFMVGYLYHKWGKDVVGGNNLIIEEIQLPSRPIKFIMAPFVLLGTVATHVFGGSVGREGTAVQIGASIADQVSSIFKLNKTKRVIILKAGVAAGFASVFGTPLAGMMFSLEVAKTGKINYSSLTASFCSAICAHLVTREITHFIHLPHTQYTISGTTSFTALNFGWAILAGIAFGLAGMCFSLGAKYATLLFSKINYPPLRPFIGGLLFTVLVLGIGYEHTQKYHGLGIEHIVKSFSYTVPSYDFLAKIILTSIILGAGFKGGEVTPLFFTGATLGNTLSKVVPLPMDLLAGMGFVAVFAAAANTPITTIIMGVELFGSEHIYYLATACIVAYLVSGKTGIYKSQVIGTAKSSSLEKHKGLKIG